jgi:hypothetical protein
VGVISFAGTTEALFWVSARQRQFDAQQISQQANNIEPIIQALRDKQTQLEDQQQANLVVRKVLDQYDKLEQATLVFEATTGSENFKDHLAAGRNTIANLKALLGNVRVQATQRGRTLFIKTAPNTFRVVFDVPMRIAPKLEFGNIPPGAFANVIENSNIGFTVVFTPSAILVETFDFSADATLTGG